MADNFNIYDWNRNRLIESTLGDAELKAKQRVDIVYNQILKDFPDCFQNGIDKASLRYSVSTAFTELSMLNEEKDLKKYTIQYWIYRNDDYDNDDIDVMASSEEEAIEKAKEETRRGKNFKVIQIDGEFIEETLSLKETLKSIVKNPKGYSKYFPDGKTDGLDPKTLNTILLKIAKDIKESKPGLWVNINAKKKRGEKPSHGNSDAFKSTVKAGKKINKEN